MLKNIGRKVAWVLLLGGTFVAGYELHARGQRLAGPPFIVRSTQTGFYLCIAEFDKNGELVRKP